MKEKRMMHRSNFRLPPSAFCLHMALLCVAVIVAVMVAHVALAQSVVEVIPLKYRSAAELVPVIRPLLPKEGSVNAFHNQLVVRTTPGNLAQIRRVVAGIDTPPRRLLITVRQETGADRSASGAQVWGTAGSHGGAGARVYGTHSLENDRNAQTVQVLEGSAGFISVGESRPVPNPQVLSTIIGGRVVPQVGSVVEYRDAASGFYVLPRVAGNRVTLDLSTHREAFDPDRQGGINTQYTKTTASGALGEWIEVAAVGQSLSDERSVLLGRTSARVDDQRRVLIKVEEIQ